MAPPNMTTRKSKIARLPFNFREQLLAEAASCPPSPNAARGSSYSNNLRALPAHPLRPESARNPPSARSARSARFGSSGGGILGFLKI
jgi:hypothetical protein